MKTIHQTQFNTLANARDYIAQLNAAYMELEKRLTSLEAKVAPSTPSRSNPPQAPLRCLWPKSTPEQTARYRAGISAAQEQLDSAKKQLHHARTIQEQGKALFLVERAKADLETAKLVTV